MGLVPQFVDPRDIPRPTLRVLPEQPENLTRLTCLLAYHKTSPSFLHHHQAEDNLYQHAGRQLGLGELAGTLLQACGSSLAASLLRLL